MLRRGDTADSDVIRRGADVLVYLLVPGAFGQTGEVGLSFLFLSVPSDTDIWTLSVSSGRSLAPLPFVLCYPGRRLISVIPTSARFTLEFTLRRFFAAALLQSLMPLS